jgi:hypothetical protein
VSETGIPVVNIPADLRITVWHSLTSWTLMSARSVLAVPETVTGSYDGDTGFGTAPEPPFIWFDILWCAALAGFGSADVDQMAAVLGAHLASAAGDWPGTEAHVRLRPVVDFHMTYQVTPGLVAAAPDHGRAALDKFTAMMRTGTPVTSDDVLEVLAGRSAAVGGTGHDPAD